MNNTPERVEVSESVVTIVWEGGAERAFTGEELRDACPCAGCREGPTKGSGLVLLDAVTITDARFVGSYAINFTFGDGHGDGIYPFSLLRSLGES
jgi:DUF971 family protein